MRFKTTSVILVALVALTVGITSSALAADSAVTGTITEVNPTAATFKMETSKGTVTYYTNENSRFSSDGRPIEMANLKVGDRVTIRANDMLENAVVSRVEVISSGPLTAENRRDVLPRTASPLPLLGLFGSLLLGAALVIRLGLRWLH